MLSLSGAFWISRAESLANDVCDEWLTEQYATSDLPPLRFLVHVGRYERAHYADPIACSRRFADVVRARGHVVRYREYPAGHDGLFWAHSLADGLIALAELAERRVGRPN